MCVSCNILDMIGSFTELGREQAWGLSVKWFAICVSLIACFTLKENDRLFLGQGMILVLSRLFTYNPLDVLSSYFYCYRWCVFCQCIVFRFFLNHQGLRTPNKTDVKTEFISSTINYLCTMPKNNSIFFMCFVV